MLINEFVVRCSKIDYRDLQTANRSIELVIEGVDTDEIVEELREHKLALYHLDFVNVLEMEISRLESKNYDLEEEIRKLNEKLNRP